MRKTIISCPLLLVSVLSGMNYAADSPIAQPFINTHEVFLALRDAVDQSPLAKLDFKEEQIQLPLVRYRSEPQIQVTRLSYDPKRNLLESRLRCTHGGCLPFYVKVLAEPPSPTIARQNVGFGAGTRIAQRHAFPPLVKAGDTATLGIITPAFHISLPVRCLQPGNVGDTIRVRDPQNQRVLTARIESKTRLTLAGEPR